MRGRAARRWVVVSALVLLGARVGWLRAQAPSQTSARDAAVAALPVRRVVLYKSGVGYFEHVGRVRGTQDVGIDFSSGQLDDVLSSLTTIDMDGGRVTGVSYNSEDAVERRLEALRLPVGQATSRAALLGALRGVRVAAGGVTGRLLGVESASRGSGATATTVLSVSVVTDDGAIRNVALEPGVDVRVLDTDVRRDLGQSLALVASARDQDRRRLTITASGTGDRDLFVSYVSEAPVWKATYRLVLPDASNGRAPILQGWAIVDNTGAQDWTNVRLSLVAGAPQSFIQKISQPYYIRRPIAPLPTQVLSAPQTHAGAISLAGEGTVTGTVTDHTGSVMPGVTIAIMRGSTLVKRAVTNASGRFQLPGIQPGLYDVTASLAGFKTVRRVQIMISAGMESVLTFQMELGSVAEEITVVAESPLVDTKARVGGSASGAQLTVNAFGTSGVAWNLEGGNITDMTSNSSPMHYNYDSFEEVQAGGVAVNTQAVGDLFSYELKDPVTVRRNQSALVPIVSMPVTAERVSIWNPASHATRPLRAIWLTNATGLTLDGGNFSVIDGQTFAGEGLMEPMKPGERRLLSYAADLGVQVVPRRDDAAGAVTSVSITHGVVVEQSEERSRQTYAIRNDDTEPRVVIVEHPVRDGWTLAAGLNADEMTAQWQRLRVPVPAKTTVNFVVDEARPTPVEYAVATMTDDRVAFFVKGQLITPEIEARLRAVQQQKVEVARLVDEGTRGEAGIATITHDEERVRSNMQALKGSREERALLQRYVKQLDDDETQLASSRKALEVLSAERAQAQATLDRLIEALSVGGY